MEGLLFGLSNNYFTDVVSTLVESTETAVESVVASSVLVALPPQEANNVTTPIVKNTFFIVCFFLSVYVWDYKYSKTIDIVNTREKN